MFVFVAFFNDISLTRYDIRRCRMIYLLRKHDIISVPIIREAYIICEADIIALAISSVTVGNGYHCKKSLLSGRQKRFFTPFDSLHLCSPKAKKSLAALLGDYRSVWRRESPLSFAAYRAAPLRSHRFVRSPVAKKQFPELFFTPFDSLHLCSPKAKKSLAALFCFWSKRRESNPHSQLGKLKFCH